MSVYDTVQELKVIRIFVTTRVYSSNKIIKSDQKVKKLKNYKKNWGEKLRKVSGILYRREGLTNFDQFCRS